MSTDKAPRQLGKAALTRALRENLPQDAITHVEEGRIAHG